jgi:hypothetical protein
MNDQEIELRKALLPFARIPLPEGSDMLPVQALISHADIKRARAALAAREEPDAELPAGWEGHDFKELDLYARSMGVDVDALIKQEHGALSSQILRVEINRCLAAREDTERPDGDA